MSVYTLFVAPIAQAWNDNVADFNRTSMPSALMEDLIRIGVLYRRQEHIELDSAETRAVNLANKANSEIQIFVMRVVGTVEVQTTGLDVDDATGITGFFQANGTAEYPGFIMFSTYNVSDVTIEAQEDNTKIDLFGCIAAEDGDSRLTTNA